MSFTTEGRDLQCYFDVDSAYSRSFWYRPPPAGTLSQLQR